MSKTDNKTSGTEAPAAASAAPAATGLPSEKASQPVPADPIPTPVDMRHPGEKLAQPVPADPIATPDPAAPAAAPKKSVAEWAKEKGMHHEFSEGKRGPNARPKAPKPLIHNPKFVHFHRARHSHGWAPNEELTEAEFDAAVKAADSHVYR